MILFLTGKIPQNILILCMALFSSSVIFISRISIPASLSDVVYI